MIITRFSFYFLFFLAFLAGCKKDTEIPQEETPPNPACDSSAKFKISYSELLHPFSLCEADDGKLYILAQNGDNETIMRVSGEGEFLSKKEYVLAPGYTPQHIVQLNNNSFLFSAANAEFYDSMVCYPYTAWYTCCYYQDTNHQCSIAYTFNTGNGMGSFATHSISHLYKVDSSLNVVWEKQFSGIRFYGRSLAKMNEQDFIFMTYHSGGQVPHPVFDTFGVFLDTVKYDFYGNSASVYRMDENGNVLWQTEVDNIYAHDLASSFTGCDVVSDGTNIFLRMEHEIIILNGSGDILSRFNVHGDCNEELMSIAAVPGNGFVCNGYYANGITGTFFMSRFSSNGTLLWDNLFPFGLPFSRLFYCNGEIFEYVNHNAYKYNEQGVLLWTKNFDFASSGVNYLSSAGCGCNGGIEVVAGNEINDFLIYKTDVHGNY